MGIEQLLIVKAKLGEVVAHAERAGPFGDVWRAKAKGGPLPDKPGRGLLGGALLRAVEPALQDLRPPGPEMWREALADPACNLLGRHGVPLGPLAVKQVARRQLIGGGPDGFAWRIAGPQHCGHAVREAWTPARVPRRGAWQDDCASPWREGREPSAPSRKGGPLARVNARSLLIEVAKVEGFPDGPPVNVKH